MTFKVHCGHCGPIVVRGDDLLLIMFRNPTMTRYVFGCPACDTTQTYPLTPAQLSTLLVNKVPSVKDFEYETGARQSPPMTESDLNSLLGFMADVDDISAAMERWMETNGQNGTPETPDSPEGARGEG